MAKKHVFISYCRVDKVQVARLCEELNAAGEAIWWDGEILGGQDWKQQIRRGMKNSYAFVLCLSEELANRVQSGVYPEVADAIAIYRQQAPGNIFLVPARLSDCAIPDIEIDDTRTLDRLQCIDLFPAANRAAGIQSLLKALRASPNHPVGSPEPIGATPVSHSSNAPSIAVSKLFRGRNQGSELLIDREKELAKLDAAWSGPDKMNIVTIVAWGGIGKTSLVAHWAVRKLAQPDHSGIERYFDWSFYSQGTRGKGGAAKAASADLFLKEALEFFGDPALAASNAGAWQKGERLAQLLGQHRTLLTLDGLEPLQDAQTGELRDDGLRALLRGLAAHNHGLCLVTTRQHLPDLNTWHQTTAPEWELARLTDEAGAALLTKLGVHGTAAEKRDLSARVKGHALTLTLLGRYLKRAHHGDIRRVDRVNFQKVNEKEQGGHAFRVIAAYERWFEESDSLSASGREVESHLGKTCLAILRMLGLFDRPATPDCLVALRDPPIPGLTDAIASLTEADWNEAVTHLVELNLVEEQPWEPRRIVGYGEEEANKVWAAAERGYDCELGEPRPLENCQSQLANHAALDAHPLIREFFAGRLQETNPAAWERAHWRLFENLRSSVPYWPEGLDGLHALFQAVVHGCQAGRYEEALARVYRDRIGRCRSSTHDSYSTDKLGAYGAALATVGHFFALPWTQPESELTEAGKTWLLTHTAHLLRSVGRLTEARETMQVGQDRAVEAQQSTSAARSTSNLSEINLTLGDIEHAVREAELSVTFANRSGNAFMRMVCVADHGDALHQAGRTAKARMLFKQAEAIQQVEQPDKPRLYSMRGFRFCDLLLADAERAAWRIICSDRRPAEDITGHGRTLKAVEHRATQTLKWVTGKLGLYQEALDHLTIGRVALYRVILEDASSDTCKSAIEEIVHHLRETGVREFLVRGLLTCALQQSVQHQPALARENLDEAQQIAERGPMQLHLADIHLHRARLFHDKEELKRARALIEQCGYWRRKPELEHAEEAAKHW
jgi:hypothetical protein